MAAPVLIDLTNYDTLLVQSTQGRAGTPDGNIFFDVATGRIELITLEELATVDLGGGLEPNPLANLEGIKLEAIYAFENQERRLDENLRKYDRYFAGTFKFGGAYEVINARKFDDADGGATSSTTDDRAKVRGSGWIERNTAGAIGRIYYGNVSLGNIEVASQPYYQLSAGGVPADYAKAGPIDEAIQVYGDAGVDANTTTFDTRTYESLKVRTFGFNYDEKVLADSGVSQMDGYSSGFALGESAHLTSGSYALVDVYGGAQIAPWTTMGLEELDTPVVISGFNEADGTFTWVLNNTIGTLDECVAFLDALAQTDDDINDHVGNTTNGKRVGVWYSYDAAGRVVTNSGADALGLYIYNIPTADEQRIRFADDAGDVKSYPFQVSIEATVGSIAVADVLAWYHSYFLAAYNTAGAITVLDSSAAEVKGNVSADAVADKISFAFDYSGDTVGGSAGTDKDCVFITEGDGGATQAKTLYTISEVTTVSFSCAPGQENNV
jgi:hypothetical protein